MSLPLGLFFSSVLCFQQQSRHQPCHKHPHQHQHPHRQQKFAIISIATIAVILASEPFSRMVVIATVSLGSHIVLNSYTCLALLLAVRALRWHAPVAMPEVFGVDFSGALTVKDTGIFHHAGVLKSICTCHGLETAGGLFSFWM